MFLHYSPFWLKLLYSSYLWRVPTQEKKLYLTFDDGPIPDVTEFVLDTLQQFKAHATFFCIGDNVRKYPAIFEKILQGRHSVGNHTYNHLNGWKTNDETYLANIDQCTRQLNTHTTLFRPPYGRIKPSQAKAVSIDKKIVMWDVLSGDYSPDVSPEKCLRKTIRYAKKGSIILFHDSLKAQHNLRYALPRVLGHFGAAGYQFEVLPMW
ncbi:polysaccharide deacetylase family protein [Rhabdobacter roseus]|uniref:Peptidoglycan/xylan/chitin deacetylase (PgdA/CDA1 family) n=1 Tax=Rhabdobacter roseus TaxID=1655419 RepID=A0A840TQ69_9BACT|nr:polysaccharide deacetylase family protein [Rhabdobacter roseus]MBB5283383.1 peptidoglycan/xylan/chitin deacetylase (PgdA/CDA1 family) [Rhabdobacter roseus]